MQRVPHYHQIMTGAYPLDSSELFSLVSNDLCPRRRSGREWAGTTCGGGRSPLGLTDVILSRSVMLSLEAKEAGLVQPDSSPFLYSPSHDSFSLSSVHVTSGIFE